MKYGVGLCLTLLACWAPYNNSFSTFGVRAFSTQMNADASSSSSESNTPPQNIAGPPPDLVDKGSFYAAIQQLKGTEEGTVTTEDLKMYAIGKLRVSLAIDTTPGLDLAETNELVLVSGVSGNAVDAGIQTGDTITGVFALGNKVRATTESEGKGLNMEETIAILQGAASHAIENGVTEIELELNRLVELRYQDEDA